MCSSAMSAELFQEWQLTHDDGNHFQGRGRRRVLTISPCPEWSVSHLRISATIHPILQISIAFEYSWNAARQLEIW